MNVIMTICNFLNVTTDQLRSLDQGVLAKMIQAVEDDDVITLHQLGYHIDKQKKDIGDVISPY